MRLDDAQLRRALPPVSVEWEQLDEHRLAAVLAAIIQVGKADHLIFTQRRADLPEHPGQVSFPGGARDGTESPETCALRESAEEIGLAADTVTVLGATPNRTSSSAFRVHTIVGRVHADLATLRPEPREVETLFTVPIHELQDDDRWEFRRVPYRDEVRHSPHFEHGPHTIWGLTGRLTRDLLAAISSIR